MTAAMHDASGIEPDRRICSGAVVVGVDGSDASAAALRWGIDEATVRDVPVVAAMAYTYLEQHHASGDAFHPTYHASDAAAAVDAFVARAVPSARQSSVRRIVGCDLPGRYLVEISESAAMLVVARRGLGHLREAMIGSTSHYCLRHTSCPLAIVNPAPHHVAGRPLRRIVVGVDDWTSFAAVRWAIEAGTRHQATVELVHARGPLAHVVDDFLAGDEPTVQESGANELVEPMLSALETWNLPAPVLRTAVRGNPARALIERSVTADLVVVGARPVQRRHVAPMWLPERLVHHASCPVVVVPSAPASSTA